MDNSDKILICLERIAFNTQGGPLEFEDFREKVLYASNVPSPAEVYGYLRAQPETREGEVPEHDTPAATRLRSDTDKGTPLQKKQPKKHDSRKVENGSETK